MLFPELLERKDLPVKHLEAVPAIRRIETNRDALFAIDVVGDVSPADAENLFGLLEAAYALHPRIDVLVRLTDEEIKHQELLLDLSRIAYCLGNIPNGDCKKLYAAEHLLNRPATVPAVSEPIAQSRLSRRDEALRRQIPMLARTSMKRLTMFVATGA